MKGVTDCAEAELPNEPMSSARSPPRLSYYRPFRIRGGADAENYETNPMAEGGQKETASLPDIRFKKLPNEAIAPHSSKLQAQSSKMCGKLRNEPNSKLRTRNSKPRLENYQTNPNSHLCRFLYSSPRKRSGICVTHPSSFLRNEAIRSERRFKVPGSRFKVSGSRAIGYIRPLSLGVRRGIRGSNRELPNEAMRSMRRFKVPGSKFKVTK